MADLRTLWNAEGGFGDLVLDGPSLAADRDLETGMVISVYTDRRAAPDDPLPYPGAGRRGWWNDGLLPVAGDRYGSRLWLLAREKQTAETLNRARAYVEESLAWLIEDGVATAVRVAVEWLRLGVLAILVRVERPERGVFERRYDYAWDQLRPAPAAVPGAA